MNLIEVDFVFHLRMGRGALDRYYVRVLDLCCIWTENKYS